MKEIALTRKELQRADTLVGWNGKHWRYTVVARPTDKGILVGLVNIETQQWLFNEEPKLFKNALSAKVGIRQMLRWLDKMGLDSNMASSARRRPGRKNIPG